MRVLDIGGNNGKRSREAYPEANITVLDLKTGFDVEKLPLPQGKWDIILVNHLIEHLGNTDEFIEKIKGIIGDAVLELSTPNMAAWFNRVLFLFGYLPHTYEVSSHFNVAKPFEWGKERLGGHKRLFTPQALKELLECYGFEVFYMGGERNTDYPINPFIKFLDWLFTKNVNLASSFRI